MHVQETNRKKGGREKEERAREKEREKERGKREIQVVETIPVRGNLSYTSTNIYDINLLILFKLDVAYMNAFMYA